MSTLDAGYRFEKFVTQLLRDLGYRAERNLIYRNGSGEKHQIDIDYEYRNGIWRKKRLVVGECKYSGMNNRMDAGAALEQLATNTKFAGADEGILFTNKELSRKEMKMMDREKGLYVCHRPILLAMDRKANGRQKTSLEKRINNIKLSGADYQPSYRSV
ncbi:MAG: restriction endonuclease [Candidatus Woesearchaeota archaeon]